MTSWKILQVSGAAEGGSWFVDQLIGLRDRGHRVHAVVPSPGSVEEALRRTGIPVEIIPFRGYRIQDGKRLIGAQRRLGTLIRRGDFDIVHAHLLKSMVVSRLAARGRSAPVVISHVPGVVHLQSRLLAAIDRSTMRWDHALIGSCTAFAEVYRRMGARQVFVNHYGFHTDRFDPDIPGAPFRAEQGAAETEILVGMVAHMYPTRLRAFSQTGVKGHETFIDAAALFLRRGTNAHFFIVGDEFAGDGSYRRTLEQRVAAHGIRDTIRFLGHRADIPHVLAGLDILVNPSLSESASYTMMEASLMRKPVVATKVGGLVDTVLDGSTGLLVRPDDPTAVSQALERLAVDSNFRRRLGIAGRSHVLANFDIAHTLDELEGIYSTVLRSRDES